MLSSMTLIHSIRNSYVADQYLRPLILFSVFPVCVTCSHMDQDTLAWLQVGRLEQHQVGGEVVDGQRSPLLKAHLLGHGEGVASGHNDHFLVHAAADQHDDPIPHLREGREEGRDGDASVVKVCSDYFEISR